MWKKQLQEFDEDSSDSQTEMAPIDSPKNEKLKNEKPNPIHEKFQNLNNPDIVEEDGRPSFMNGISNTPFFGMPSIMSQNQNFSNIMSQDENDISQNQLDICKLIEKYKDNQDMPSEEELNLI